MKKRFSAKIQKLTKEFTENVTAYSDVLAIEPDDFVTIEKKGIPYIVFDVASGVSFDSKLVSKIVYDVLHDTYFTSDTVSPIQSIEKSILSIREKLLQMLTDPRTAQSNYNVSFNCIISVLWGNVFYLVQYGDAFCYIMRDAEVNTISTATEGKFSVASGLVKDNDVVFLSTDGFAKVFPPEKLLNGQLNIVPSKFSNVSAALLLKFVLEVDLNSSEQLQISDSSEEETNAPVYEQVDTLALDESQVDASSATTTSSFAMASTAQNILGYLKNVAAKISVPSKSTKTLHSSLGQIPTNEPTVVVQKGSNTLLEDTFDPVEKVLVDDSIESSKPYQYLTEKDDIVQDSKVLDENNFSTFDQSVKQSSTPQEWSLATKQPEQSPDMPLEISNTNNFSGVKNLTKNPIYLKAVRKVKQRPVLVMIGVVVILLGVSVFYTYKNSKNVEISNNSNNNTPAPVVNDAPKEPVIDLQKQSEEDKKKWHC